MRGHAFINLYIPHFTAGYCFASKIFGCLLYNSLGDLIISMNAFVIASRFSYPQNKLEVELQKALEDKKRIMSESSAKDNEIMRLKVIYGPL